MGKFVVWVNNDNKGIFEAADKYDAIAKMVDRVGLDDLEDGHYYKDPEDDWNVKDHLKFVADYTDFGSWDGLKGCFKLEDPAIYLDVSGYIEEIKEPTKEEIFKTAKEMVDTKSYLRTCHFRGYYEAYQFFDFGVLRVIIKYTREEAWDLAQRTKCSPAGYVKFMDWDHVREIGVYCHDKFNDDYKIVTYEK